MLIKAKKINDFIKTINTGSCPFLTSISATSVFFVWPYQMTLFFILLQWDKNILFVCPIPVLFGIRWKKTLDIHIPVYITYNSFPLCDYCILFTHVFVMFRVYNRTHSFNMGEEEDHRGFNASLMLLNANIVLQIDTKCTDRQNSASSWL